MFDFLSFSSNGGNALLWIIVGCSIVGFTVFIERFFFLRKSSIDTNRLMVDLRKVIKENNIDDGIHMCERMGGPVAEVLFIGLSKSKEPRENIERSMELAGVITIAQLEKNTKALSIIAHISPLIGLLGTVLGFIQAFGEMRKSGLVDISTTRIGDAMQYALVTTAAGLVVAIPCIVAYNYLVGRIRGIVLQIQTAASELIDMLKDNC